MLASVIGVRANAIAIDVPTVIVRRRLARLQALHERARAEVSPNQSPS